MKRLKRFLRVTCATCKTAFVRRRIRLSGHDLHYCSRPCQIAARKAARFDGRLFGRRKPGELPQRASRGYVVACSLENFLSGGRS